MVLHQVREAVAASTAGEAFVTPLSMPFVDPQGGPGVVVERANALVLSALWLHAMITPDEVGQGHGVADALDEVSIKQGREVSLKKTKILRRCRPDRKRDDGAKQKRHSPEKCPCWAVRSFEGVEKVGREVFRIFQMYAAFRLGVVHLTKMLVFFLTNRGQTFSDVGMPFASLFCGQSPSGQGIWLGAVHRLTTHGAPLHPEGLTRNHC